MGVTGGDFPPFQLITRFGVCRGNFILREHTSAPTVKSLRRKLRDVQRCMLELVEWLQGRCCPGSLPRDGHGWVHRCTDMVLFFLTPVVDQRAGRSGPELVSDETCPKGSRSALERELQLEELGAQSTTHPEGFISRDCYCYCCLVVTI